MARFDVIPKSGGTARYSGTPTFTGTYMKPGMLEFREVASPTPIEWTAGDYVVYSRTGYTYRLYTVPQLKKQARSNSYGGAYIYQGVQFFDDSKQLEICPFRDLVLGDNRIHFSTQPSISTFEGVDGIARRLQACLDDMYPNTWYVRLATTAMGASQDLVDLMSEAREFTVSGVSLLGALDKVYEVWPEVGWVFTRGQVTINGSSVTRNIITIGGGGLTATSSYLYGKGNGLLSITRTVANAEELANRIFAYGSSRNMLPRWYNSQNIKDAESVDIQNLMIPVSEWGETDNLPDAAKAFVEDSTSITRLGLRPTTVYFDGTGELPEIYPTIRETTIKMVRQALGSSSAKYYPSTTVYTNENVRVDRVLSAPVSFDSGLAADEGKSALASEYGDVNASGTTTIQSGSAHNVQVYTKSITSTASGVMNLNASFNLSGTISALVDSVVMQVAFAKNGYTAYYRNIELEDSGGGSWSYPTSGVTANDIPVAVGDTITCTATLIFTNRTGSSASCSYSAVGSYSFKMTYTRAKTFRISIRQVGFDIGAQADLGDGKTIAMRSGKCAGRTFTIKDAQYIESTDSWVLDCWRSEDESLAQWFPNTDYPVRGLENAGQSNEYPGDEFVILDIAMPDIYVQMAEQRLLDAAEELLADTATERWQYIPEIDAKFMVENSRTIVAGQNMTLQDADIIGLSSVAVLVDSLTISEGEAAIPTYKVTLRDRKRKTWTDSGSAPSISSKPVSNATQESIQSVSNSVADSFFELDENGDVTLKPQYANLWVSGFLTAGGRNSGGGGGGGGGDVSYLNDLSDVTAPNPSSGDLLGWNGSAWVNIDRSSLVSLTAGTGKYTISVSGTSIDVYTKGQVDALVEAVNKFDVVVESSLPTASADTMYKIYLIPSADPQTGNVKDEYITVRSGSVGSYTYSWEQIGSTAIDLSGYALLTDIPTSLSQLSDDSTHRLVTDTQINNWNDAYDGLRIYDLEDNGTTTAGAWKGKNAKITALTDGLMVRYKVTVAGASTTKLTVNSLGAKTVYRYGSTKLTDVYGVGSYLVLYYSSSLNSGCWMVLTNYDANSYAYVRQYVATDNVEYSLLARYTTASVETYETKYTKFADAVTLNPSTGKITANGFKVTGGSGFLKADGTSGALVSTDIPDLSDTYVTVAGVQTITGAKSFAEAVTLSGSTNTARRIYFGDSTHYLELDQYGFHFSHGVYSDDFVSAGGIGTGGGSGSVAYLNDLTDVTAPSPSSGDLLSWSGSAWVNVAQSTITPDLSAYALKTGADTYNFLVNSLKFKNTGHDDSYISADSGPGPVYYQHQRLKWTYSRTSGSISDPDVTESKYVAFLDDIPSSLKNPYKLTFGSKEYDGSAAVSLTASDIGALTSVAFSDLSAHPTTLSGYGITDAKIASGVITLGSNTITPLTSHQTVTLAGGTNNGTLKLTVGGTATDNIAVTGLGSLAYKSSLVAADIPDISDTYVTKATTQTVSGVKTFTGGIVMSGADIVLGNADHIDIGPVRLQYNSTTGCLQVTTNQTGNNAPVIGLHADGQLAAGGVGANGSGGGGYGVESITSNQDGTVDFHFTGGDVTTVDLNHEHPQYCTKLAESSQPSGGFLPDVVYELGTLTGSVTFALASAVSGQVNHYFWTFTAGSTAPTITWPSGITWVDSAPTITAGNKYQISILDGIAAYMEA